MMNRPRTVVISALLLTTTLLAACSGSPSSPQPRCHGNCSTHTEGYEWAQRGDYEDPAVCEGYSAAFTDGCRDGVEDRNQMRRATRAF